MRRLGEWASWGRQLARKFCKGGSARQAFRQSAPFPLRGHFALCVYACLLQVSLPTFQHGLPAYYVLAVSEASSNLARYDGVRYGLRDKQAKDLNVSL